MHETLLTNDLKHSELSHIERASSRDLASVNAVIQRAIMTWSMSERVKRRAVTILQYDQVDAANLALYVCRSGTTIIGVIALDFDYKASRAGCRGILLHGIYVDPATHRRRVGQTLMKFAERQAVIRAEDGVWIKAERVSRRFFERCGYIHCAPKSDADYPYLYWKGTSDATAHQSNSLLE